MSAQPEMNRKHVQYLLGILAISELRRSVRHVSRTLNHLKMLLSLPLTAEYKASRRCQVKLRLLRYHTSTAHACA